MVAWDFDIGQTFALRGIQFVVTEKTDLRSVDPEAYFVEAQPKTGGKKHLMLGKQIVDQVH